MASKIHELNEKDFNAFIKKDKVVVDFWAPWCGPCKIMGPIFEEASKELKDTVKFAKVNVDENIELAQRFQVMSIPTTIVFRDGQQVERMIGVVSKEDLIGRVKKAK